MDNGRVFSCGNNDYSQLGREGRTTVPECVILPNDAEGVQVACGQHFSLCLTITGRIVCWGSINGKIGSDDGFFYPKPQYVSGFEDKRMIQIATGYSHALTLTDDGTVYSFGVNSAGQLGLGNSDDCVCACPLLCLRGSPICYIACGANHSVIISKSGTVFTCGLNSSGQLGVGDTESRIWPSNVKAVQNQKVTYASCGEKHTVVITADGGVFSFGSGSHGQLGHNSVMDELLPKKISELMGSEVTQVACGRSHTVVFVPSVGQILVFGLACAGRPDTQLTSYVAIPTKLQYPFVSYRAIGQLQRQMSHSSDRSGQQQQQNVQVVFITAGGHQTFIRISHKSQRPADYRLYSLHRPILELTLEFAKSLCHVEKSPVGLTDAK
ncbi:unnamed protein product, partial [Didymodactylos carnosus]